MSLQGVGTGYLRLPGSSHPASIICSSLTPAAHPGPGPRATALHVHILLLHQLAEGGAMSEGVGAKTEVHGVKLRDVTQ